MFAEKTKKIIAVTMLVVLALSSTACVFIKKKETVEQAVELYYVKQAYIEGEIEKDVFVMYKDVVEIPEDLLGNTASRRQEYVASAALKMLNTVPDDIKSKATTVVSGDFNIKSVHINEGTAVVDIDSESIKTGGGSAEESILISQIVSTLMSSLDEIKGVKFLVDGKEKDSLMGHIDISETFVSPTIK